MKLSKSFVTSTILSTVAADQQWPLLTPHGSADASKDSGKNPVLPYRDLIYLHGNLTSIPSITGNEHDAGVFLETYLRDSLNFTVERLYVSSKTFSSNPSAPMTEDHEATVDGKPDKRRFNILAYPGSNVKEARTLISSHIDTVPPFIPYAYRATQDGWGDSFSGRGSVDAKGSVAAQLGALESLLKDGAINPDDVAVLYVVGEETTGDGMRAASAALEEKEYTNWENVIFSEPTEGKLACGHKGISLVSLTARGKSAHSGYPWLGVSANTILIRALAAIEDVALKKGVEEGGLPYSDKYGWTTVNVGVISGGVAANVIPAEAHAQITLRLADGTPADAFDILNEAATKATEELRSKGGSLELQRSPKQGYAPVDINCDVDGFETVTVNYGTDVPNFQVKGNYRRYLYGPGSILVAHSDHEAGTMKDLVAAVEGMKTLIKHTLSA
ncbi:hypothetical protein FH972_021044 [Carpinus fangiana]|uniref:Peptidase M20 dimerisation domain-containing protein n=1 Tax=Carpinus fangiana TaxID=176857 RepID=A0A5N6KNS3_9ROSI|nr:hypothetical protein FH972_021044 [Carpinus fangiana]